VAEERWEERVARERRENMLQAGWVVEIDGKEYVVDYVNESRAYCLPLAKREVEIETDEVDDETGEKKKRKFGARERGVNIAPCAMVKILRKEEPMAKRLCVICGKGLHSDNKGDTHRACRKQANPVAEAIENAQEVETSASTEAPADVEPAAAPGEATTDTNNVSAAAEPQKKEKPVAKKATKKAAEPKGEGRAVNSYTTAAKQPKEGEFREGSQIALVYEAVSSIGTATAAEVTARVAKKAQSKGDLKANVAFYLSKLKGAGFIKIAR
jgi:hypothetical protein